MGHYVSQKEGFKLVGAATLKALSLKLWRLVQGGRRADPCPRTRVGRGVLVREIRKVLRGLRMEEFLGEEEFVDDVGSNWKPVK